MGYYSLLLILTVISEFNSLEVSYAKHVVAYYLENIQNIEIEILQVINRKYRLAPWVVSKDHSDVLCEWLVTTSTSTVHQ